MAQAQKLAQGNVLLNNKGIPGHLNFDFTTFHGVLGWEGLSFDGDYGFNLQPVQGGITLGNWNGEEPPSLKVEFSSLESLNRADDLPPWWAQFRELAIESRSKEPVTDFLMGENQNEAPFAIVTGLLGLDCVHECHSELHPVYAMAVRVRNELDSERWVVFVRNWGNQGWCSQKNHPLTKDKRIVTDIRLLLPNPKAVDATITSSNFKSYKTGRPSLFGWLQRNPGEATGHAPVIYPGSGVVLAFDLPDPRDRSMILGELEIQWTPRKQERDTPALLACPLPASRTKMRTTDPEDRYEDLLKKLPQGKWEEYRAELAADPTGKIKGVEVRLPPAITYPSGITPTMDTINEEITITVASEGSYSSQPIRPPRARARKDREKIHTDERLIGELCEAAGDLHGDPDFERLCGVIDR